MKRRQRRIVKKVVRNQVVPGIGWYSREQYARLLEASEDRDGMNATWEGWEAKAREMLASLKGRGIPAREVPIDVEEVIAWCASQGRPVNGAARAELIFMKCQELLNREKRIT